MTNDEKKNVIDNLFVEIKFDKEKIDTVTGGYTQIMPKGDLQLVLLMGFGKTKNPISEKFPLHDEEEALEVFQALFHFIGSKNGKTRKRLSKDKIVTTDGIIESNVLDIDEQVKSKPFARFESEYKEIVSYTDSKPDISAEVIVDSIPFKSGFSILRKMEEERLITKVQETAESEPNNMDTEPKDESIPQKKKSLFNY